METLERFRSLVLFAYVESMPVIVNQNKCLGLKVANGSEFVAKGIVPDPNVQEHVVDEGLSKGYTAEGVVRKWTNVSLYVQTSRCQGLDKTRLLQPVRAKDFLESCMYPDLIAGNERLKKASDKTTRAFAARHAG